MANVLRKMKEGAVNFALQGDYRKDALKAIEEQEEIKIQKKARKNLLVFGQHIQV